MDILDWRTLFAEGDCNYLLQICVTVMCDMALRLIGYKRVYLQFILQNDSSEFKILLVYNNSINVII